MFIYIPIKISSSPPNNNNGKKNSQFIRKKRGAGPGSKNPKEGNTGRIRIRIMVRIGEVQGRVIVCGEICFRF